MDVLAEHGIPVAGATGIATLVMLAFFFMAPGPDSKIFFFLALVPGTICFFAFKSVYRLMKDNQALVDTISAKENLQLDKELLLAGLSCNFVAFDPSNRKMVVCDGRNEKYVVWDFSHVLNWYFENSRSTVYHVEGNSVSADTKEKDFFLVFEVADPHKPRYKFPLTSRRDADVWVARLRAIFAS